MQSRPEVWYTLRWEGGGAKWVTPTDARGAVRGPMEQVDVALVSKFDAWLDLLDTYRIEVADSGRRILRCSCPGGHRWCRHKQMLVQFCKQHRMDKGWFFNWETKAWKEPLRHG